MKEEKDIEYYRQFGDGNPYFYKFLIEEQGWNPEDIEIMEDNLDYCSVSKEPKKDDFVYDGERKISDGSGAFYVLDDSVEKDGYDSLFVKYLEDEGFIKGDKHGYYGGPGIWVNLYSKTYAFNMPGVALTKPIGRCKITSDEFKVIYDIIKNKDKHNL